MIEVDERCTGCTACMTICHTNAISMQSDNKGFEIPKIDNELCVNCEMCVSVCPKETSEYGFNNPVSAYAMKTKDEETRTISTSGGAFSVLYNYFISAGGVVYGVMHDSEFNVIHNRAEDSNTCMKMHGSKYVQSRMGDSISKVINDIRNNRMVLFTGTPCQIDGLLNCIEMLGEKADLLYTCQIICHGVPSPRIWKDHLRFIEQVREKRILKYIHRPKDYGWHEHNEKVIFEDGSFESQSKLSQNFKDLFYLGYSLRDCCFNCKYAGMAGRADFTIGDFWGVETIIPSIDDNKGTSIVFVNSSRGEEILSMCKKEYYSNEVSFKDAIMYNHKKPSRRPEDVEIFWEDYLKNGYEYVVRKYAGYHIPKRILYRFKKILRRFLVKHKVIGH